MSDFRCPLQILFLLDLWSCLTKGQCSYSLLWQFPTAFTVASPARQCTAVFAGLRSDTLQLFILESLRRFGVQEAKSAASKSETENVLQRAGFTALHAEGKVHRTQARIPTCCHTVDTYCNCTPLRLTHTNVMTSVNETSLYDFYLKKNNEVHFESVPATSVTVKCHYIYKYI